MFIPDDAETRSVSERSGNSSRDFEGFNLSTITRAFGEVDWTNLWDIFLVRFLLGSAVLIYRNNFSAILDLNFQVSV